MCYQSPQCFVLKLLCIFSFNSWQHCCSFDNNQCVRWIEFNRFDWATVSRSRTKYGSVVRREFSEWWTEQVASHYRYQFTIRVANKWGKRGNRTALFRISSADNWIDFRIWRLHDRFQSWNYFHQTTSTAIQYCKFKCINWLKTWSWYKIKLWIVCRSTGPLCLIGYLEFLLATTPRCYLIDQNICGGCRKSFWKLRTNERITKLFWLKR